MQFVTTFVVLSLSGLIDASYLAYTHRSKKMLVCPIGSDCDAVVESRWGTTLGIRNELLGVVFYLGMLLLGISFAAFPGYIEFARMLVRAGAAIGLGFSLFLTYIQVRVIRQYCMYCLLSATISAFLFLNAFVL